MSEPTNENLPDFDDWDGDEEEFIPCDKCDGHDACRDFGCAIEAGLGYMVEKNRNEMGYFDL